MDWNRPYIFFITVSIILRVAWCALMWKLMVRKLFFVDISLLGRKGDTNCVEGS